MTIFIFLTTSRYASFEVRIEYRENHKIPGCTKLRGRPQHRGQITEYRRGSFNDIQTMSKGNPLINYIV